MTGIPVNYNNSILQQVYQYMYLGVVIDSDPDFTFNTEFDTLERAALV